MIRILANLYKSRGEVAPVLTAADFRLDDDASRASARCSTPSRTSTTARCARRPSRTSFRSPSGAPTTPALPRICRRSWARCGCDRLLSATWLAPNRQRCRSTSRATRRSTTTPSRSSWRPSSRTASTSTRTASAGLPRGREPARQADGCARNDKLFADGSDQAQLAKQVRYVIGGTDEVAKTFRVIALPKVLADRSVVNAG
jgi:hypothetical protein